MFMSGLSRLPFAFFHAGFSALAVWAQSLLVKIDPKPERVRALNFFRNGALLRAMRWEGRQEYPVYVINRKKDSDRLGRFRKSCAKWGVDFERLEAINCADLNFDYKPYNSQIADTFYGKTQFLRGAVGCFLSHFNIWQKIVDMDLKLALICEDDARFLGPIPHRIVEYNLPQGADLIFANQRTSVGIQGLAQDCPPQKNSFDFFPINDAILSQLKTSSAISAIGTDGYILTTQGAQKLLAIFHQSKICMEVDWFLFFHSLTQGEREKFIHRDATGRFDMLEFASGKLNSFVIVPSFVEQRSMESIISFDKPAHYIERDAMFESVNIRG